MATVTHDGLEVCTDCAQLIANGDLGGQECEHGGADDHAAAMVAVWGEGPAGVLGLVLELSEETEAHFSSRRCDGCGSTLAGDRLPAVHIA